VCGNLSSETSHAQGGRQRPLAVCLNSDLDVYRVRISNVGSGRLFDCADLMRSFVDNWTILAGDHNLCCDGIDEGVFVQWVQETVEVFTLVPDDFRCSTIYDECEYDGNPVLLVRTRSSV
jgi:hypothetical protein